MHRWTGDQLVNNKGKVLEYSTGNAHCARWSAAGRQLTKRWRLLYVDQIPRDPIKGEMAVGWGFLVETDFHLIS